MAWGGGTLDSHEYILPQDQSKVAKMDISDVFGSDRFEVARCWNEQMEQNRAPADACCFLKIIYDKIFHLYIYIRYPYIHTVL